MGARRQFRGPRRLQAGAGAALAACLVAIAAPSGPLGDNVTSAGAGVTAKLAADEAPASVTVVEPAADAPSKAPEPAVRIASTGTGPAVGDSQVPALLLRAYRAAAGQVPASCHLPVSLLAAIGQVESGSLAGRPLDAEHRTSILGPVLDGNGFAAIRDTDDGRWDGDAKWDRAMGPMQFIPSTWKTFGVDGDRDGVADPQDVEDAAAATAGYLCYGDRDLSSAADLRAAVLSYNHSSAYLRLVLTYQQRFAGLGLDRGVALTGLAAGIALSATPVTGLAVGSTVPAAPRTRAPRKTTVASGPVEARTPAAQHADRPTAEPTPSAKPSHKPGAGSTTGTATGTTTGPTTGPTSTPTPTTPPSPKPVPSPTPTGGQTGTPSPSTPPSTSPHPSPTPDPTPSTKPDPTPSPTTSPTTDPTTPSPDPVCPPEGSTPGTEGTDGVECPPCGAPADETTATGDGSEDGPDCATDGRSPLTGSSASTAP